jgi:hypothetical protein
LELDALEEALADYVRVLLKSAATTGRAEDRNLYTKHLAEAARLFVCIRDSDFDSLLDGVRQENRSFGWAYLTGDAGEVAEKAWHSFATLVESSRKDR